jgi:hypothetical protein
MTPASGEDAVSETREVLNRNVQFLREFIRMGGNTHLIHKAGQLLMDTCKCLEVEATPAAIAADFTEGGIDMTGGGK